MKIYKNQEDLMNAWMLGTHALEIIKNTLLDNSKCSEEVIDAYYLIMKTMNNWHEEIKQMPF